MESTSRAVFLDRDGVLVRDAAPLVEACQIEILPGVPESLDRLRDAGFRLVVVSNQAIVARGILAESAMIELHRQVEAQIVAAGGPRLDGFYHCPHHPNATLAAYREECACRKPRPGLLIRAAEDLGLSLPESFMVGDRLTDIAAGHRAGCRTVWVQTGSHTQPRIETPDPVDPGLEPSHVCADLPTAADWILSHR